MVWCVMTDGLVWSKHETKTEANDEAARVVERTRQELVALHDEVTEKEEFIMSLTVEEEKTT